MNKILTILGCFISLTGCQIHIDEGDPWQDDYDYSDHDADYEWNDPPSAETCESYFECQADASCEQGYCVPLADQSQVTPTEDGVNDASSPSTTTSGNDTSTVPEAPETSPDVDGGTCDVGDAGASVCNNRSAVCFSSADCDDGLCINGRCHTYCEATSECQVDQACVLGVCRELATLECLTGEECANGEDCVSGMCARRCLNNSDCLDCDDGPVCRNGYCGQ